MAPTPSRRALATSPDLQRRIESLERSTPRWRLQALAGWAALALQVLGGTAVGVSGNLTAVAAERRAEEARREAEAERARAEQALIQAFAEGVEAAEGHDPARISGIGGVFLRSGDPERLNVTTSTAS